MAFGASVLVNGGFLFAVAGLSPHRPPLPPETPVFEVTLDSLLVSRDAKAPTPTPTPTPSPEPQPPQNTAQPAPAPPVARPEPALPSAQTPPAADRPSPRDPAPTATAQPSPSASPLGAQAARGEATGAKATSGATVPPTASQPSSSSAPPARSAATATGRHSAAYAALLRRHLEGFKVYPAQARRRRQEGGVTLAFVIDRQGRVLSSQVIRSSGNPLLDQAALAMLEAAQPLPRPPSDLGGDRLSLTYETAFSLTES